MLHRNANFHIANNYSTIAGDLNYDADTLDVLTELFDNADNNIPDDILNTQTTRGSPQVPHVDKLVPNHT